MIQATFPQLAVTMPRPVPKVQTPPLKSQGIKTKLVPFILANVQWDGTGRWIEPFAGTAVVALNTGHPRQLSGDANEHIIRLHQAIADGMVTAENTRSHLVEEGRKLAETNGQHYYEVRRRFNQDPTALDFLFLNRSCFNGIMRFNRKGHYNVPWGRKLERFRTAYVTKVTNQVQRFSNVVQGGQWEFQATDWRTTLARAQPGDFVYVDPPYAGRHANYLGQLGPWTRSDEAELTERLNALPCGFAMSTWHQDQRRTNQPLPEYCRDWVLRTTEHHYHVGAASTTRHPVIEALLIHPEFAAIQNHQEANP